MFQTRDAMKMLQRIAQSCLEIQGTVHCTQKPSLSVAARIMQIYLQLSRSVKYLSQSFSTLLKAVNSHRFNQSDLDTRSWYHGTAASMECLQAPPWTPSSPDCSRLVMLTLDYTRLARSKTIQEPVRRLVWSKRDAFKKVTPIIKSLLLKKI